MVKWFKRVGDYFGSRTRRAEQGNRELFFAEQDTSGTPWAIFEIMDFDGEGRVKVEFNWNAAFIKRLDELGFTAETEEDTVQLFFYASQMKPTTMSGGDQTAMLADLPNLSENVNRVVR